MDDKPANTSASAGQSNAEQQIDTSSTEQAASVQTIARSTDEPRQAYGTAKTENLRDSGAWRVLLPGFVVLCCLALLAVPLLILIPLLSDSINATAPTHGLIWLWISMIVIEVEDNGVGMGAVQLLERPTGLGGSGIGMANVAGRLKVLYGDSARMHIDSHEGKGTLIRLRLPIMQTERSLPAALSYEASTRR